MRRTTTFFLLLLVAINVIVFARNRFMPFFESMIVLNAAVCASFVWNAFYPPKITTRPRPVMKAVIIVLMLTLNSLLFMGAYIRLQAAKFPVSAMSAQAPSVKWIASDGSSHTLAELSGHPVVLHFWATWCGPCRREFPKFLAFAAAHPDVSFLAVDAMDEAPKADEYLKSLSHNAKLPANLLFASDPQGAISYGTFNLISFPSTILIDDTGRMRWKMATSVEWDAEDIHSKVDALKTH